MLYILTNSSYIPLFPKVLSHREPPRPLPFLDKLTDLKIYTARIAVGTDAVVIHFLKMATVFQSLIITRLALQVIVSPAPRS